MYQPWSLDRQCVIILLSTNKHGIRDCQSDIGMNATVVSHPHNCSSILRKQIQLISTGEIIKIRLKYHRTVRVSCFAVNTARKRK